MGSCNLICGIYLISLVRVDWTKIGIFDYFKKIKYYYYLLHLY